MRDLNKINFIRLLKNPDYWKELLEYFLNKLRYLKKEIQQINTMNYFPNFLSYFHTYTNTVKSIKTFLKILGIISKFRLKIRLFN